MHSRELLCPSTQPTGAGAQVFAILTDGPAGPRMTYLERPVPASAELLSQAQPVDPTEVFRIAGRCQEGQCRHFDGAQCQLVGRVAAGLHATGELPRCPIRADCRWFAQESVEACRRCSQVVTTYHNAPPELVRVALPES